MKKSRHYKNILLGAILWLLAIVFFIPIYYLIVSTFKSADAVTTHPFSLPTSFDFSHYITAWEKMEYPKAFFNTFIITLFTVVFGGQPVHCRPNRDR